MNDFIIIKTILRVTKLFPKNYVSFIRLSTSNKKQYYLTYENLPNNINEFNI